MSQLYNYAEEVLQSLYISIMYFSSNLQPIIIHDLYPVTLMTKVSKQTLTINSVSQSVHKLKTNIKLYGFICYLKVYKNNKKHFQ